MTPTLTLLKRNKLLHTKKGLKPLPAEIKSCYYTCPVYATVLTDTSYMYI